ncbi:Protein of unknown function (DUF3632) [Geosmithia morbida]|uniref:Uncharacterized protein n=1 Tax=Geosmithia morbida TaxID=1094350 RepID=A0A9P4Z0R9_9HYPO|nr:Protein of unknown function (DUF3632) [Geosmithia morbida]KAF4125575.1 Protein of unknown function (DUF3632) [Geosmithia morbida]
MSAIDVRSLASRHPHASASKMADILDLAVNGGGQSAPSADDVASALDSLFGPQQQQAGNEAESLFWTLWTLYIDVARRVPAVDDDRQKLLVSAVEALKSRKRGSVRVWSNDSAVWGDLPMLGPCMREAWNSTPNLNGSEADKAAMDACINVNSFAARLLGSSVTTWDNLAVWSLRDTLETELTVSNGDGVDASISVACEWLHHAGKALHDKGSGASAANLDDATRRVLRPGSLFDGESGLNDKRWRFWRNRLAALAGKATDVEVKTRAQSVVQLMDMLGA